MPTAEFEGQRYDFPEGTTQEEMMQAIDSIPAEEETETKAEPFREEETIKRDEGIRRDKDGSHMSYNDADGNLTGGIGHLMTDEEKELYPKGEAIPKDVVDNWFKTDMAEADDDITSILEKKQVRVPDEVFDILQNMAFNLGRENLLEFEDMWAAVEVGDWQTVSAEMLDSEWAKDVGNRAVRLADRMAAVQSNKQIDEQQESTE